MWVSNTESDVFRVGKTGLIYYLVAGRWFSAQDFTGPWTFATLTCPKTSRRSRSSTIARACWPSVPGSPQAAEAVMLASIPQTARVNKKTMQPPTVAYDGGTPKFEPIEKTTVSRAVNTDKDIIKVGDLVLHVLPGRVVHGEGARRPVGSDEQGARRKSTRFRSARRPTT